MASRTFRLVAGSYISAATQARAALAGPSQTTLEPCSPLVRVPSLDAALLMRVLDAGAYGVICPMISSAKQAEELVDACRYPPVGSRSFGPARGLLYGGADYVAHANAEILVIPMIETVEAVRNIDAILAVEGVDMIYVGPNDMAVNRRAKLTHLGGL